MLAFTRSYVPKDYRKLYHNGARKQGRETVVERIEKEGVKTGICELRFVFSFSEITNHNSPIKNI